MLSSSRRLLSILATAAALLTTPSAAANDDDLHHFVTVCSSPTPEKTTARLTMNSALTCVRQNIVSRFTTTIRSLRAIGSSRHMFILNQLLRPPTGNRARLALIFTMAMAYVFCKTTDGHQANGNRNSSGRAPVSGTIATPLISRWWKLTISLTSR